MKKIIGIKNNLNGSDEVYEYKKKDTKLTLDLTNLIAEEVYRKVMDRNWKELDRLKEQMEIKIDQDTKRYSKAVASEIVFKIKNKLI
jgi:hypothetical protein